MKKILGLLSVLGAMFFVVTFGWWVYYISTDMKIDMSSFNGHPLFLSKSQSGPFADYLAACDERFSSKGKGFSVIWEDYQGVHLSRVQKHLTKWYSPYGERRVVFEILLLPTPAKVLAGVR